MTKPIGVALLVLFCVLAPRAQAQWRVPVNCDVPLHNGDCALYGLSMVQLLANPEKYDGDRIRVAGYIHFEPDSNAIYLHREDLEHHIFRNGVWVSMSEGTSPEGCQDSYVVIEGVYRARTTGRMSLWSGEITRITRCQKLP